MGGNPGILREPSRLIIRAEDGTRINTARESATLWRHAGVEVTLSIGGRGMRIEIVSPELPLTHIELHWPQSLPLGVFLSDHWERSYGDLCWRGMQADHPMPWYFLLADGARTYAAGVKTGGASLCWWNVDPQGITLTLDIRSGGIGVQLGDRRLDAAEVREATSEEAESPFAFARRFARLLCDEPLLPDHPVYGANNWYYAYGHSSEQQILADTEETAELSSNSRNRPFSVIDMGWEDVGCCEGSHWRRSNARFPDMAMLAARIRRLGARPGIWYRPLLAMDSVNGNWTLPCRKPLVGTGEVVLDPTIPEVLERIRGDVMSMTGWGYELIKHDFSAYDVLGRWGATMGDTITDGGWRFHDSTLTTAEVLLRLYRTIREAADKALIIGCNTFGHLCAGQVHLQRIGDDTSGREWERTRKMGVNALAFRAHQHETFFSADADCVGITKAIPWAFNRQWLELLAASGTPLFVSAQAGTLSRQQRAALREAYAQAACPQAVAEPLDWMLTSCPTRWNCGGKIREWDWFHPRRSKRNIRLKV
jgi:alpha-galactosidase